MTAAMVLDLLLAGLLVATIVYAVLLNRRLAVLRRGKEELRALIADFVTASEKARVGMSEMRAASETTGRALKEMVEEAQALREDLGFLIERGGTMADRLEQDVRSNRARAPSASTVASPGAGAAKATAADAAAPNDPIVKLRRILEATR